MTIPCYPSELHICHNIEDEFFNSNQSHSKGSNSGVATSLITECLHYWIQNFMRETYRMLPQVKNWEGSWFSDAKHSESSRKEVPWVYIENSWVWIQQSRKGKDYDLVGERFLMCLARKNNGEKDGWVDINRGFQEILPDWFLMEVTSLLISETKYSKYQERRKEEDEYLGSVITYRAVLRKSYSQVFKRRHNTRRRNTPSWEQTRKLLFYSSIMSITKGYPLLKP